jgi:predicted nucleotidyltransferase
MQKTICKIIAGSRLYGLDTPESDIDTRGVFISTGHAEILGLSRDKIIKNEGEDTLLIEFRHYLGHLQRTNTSAIELLFAEKFEVLEDEFKVLKENRLNLIDSERLFHSLVGYIHGERRLANGERTGELGGKRKAHIDKYGFSPKNFSHLLRLAHCGEVFFRTSEYPTSLKDDPARDLIFSVKTEPEKYTKDKLNLMSDAAIGRLEKSYENRKDTFRFDSILANRLCLDFYWPFLKREKK